MQLAGLLDPALARPSGGRSVLGKVTPLHGDFTCEALAETLYLHDMAVAPDHAAPATAAVAPGDTYPDT
jgi:hypothetical protein